MTYQKSAEHDLLTVADLNKFIMAIGRGTPLSEYCDHCTGDKAAEEHGCDRNICTCNGYNGIGCDECVCRESPSIYPDSAEEVWE